MKKPKTAAATWCSLIAALALAPAPGILFIHVQSALAAESETGAGLREPPGKENSAIVNPGATREQQEKWRQATPQEREQWRQAISKTPKPGKGCFEASYPDKQWHEVPCGKSNRKLYPPKRGAMSRTDQVGGAGPDFSAQVTGHISEAIGSFDSVSGLTSEKNSNGTADAYSLQLNTNTFSTSTCSTAPDHSCTGWEQFVYDSSGSTQIQYWLINWGPSGSQCPTPRGAHCQQGFVSTDGWCPQTVSGFTDVLCVVDAASPPPASSEPATSLKDLEVKGIAASGSSPDSMVMTIAGHATTGNGGNFFPDLGSQWQIAEFNVFGDGNSDEADFNSGTTIVVRTSVDSGSSGGPTCDQQSFTGESNNLTLVATEETVTKSQFPSLVFTESNAPGSTQVACADAVSIGDTHLTTFDGLHYDFQASGEFVLAQDGSSFVVQTRQASGAPRWPEAAVNKAVAIRMGKTRVALYIEPARLVVDGAKRNLANGRSIDLPTGVRISRHGDQYLVADESGDSVQATLNSTWMDVKVGLGRAASSNTRGLLGNPKGNAHALATSTGAVLKEPVSFNDLYHKYADSWRVKPKDSLFAERTAIKAGIPSKPFFAKDLDPAAEARAKEACKAAGVTHQDLLEDCTLDATVLDDEKAVKVFVHAPLLLRRVIKPAL